MLAVGIWLGVLGYTTFYYGVKLWSGAPVAFAEALGFNADGGGGSTAGSSVPGSSTTAAPQDRAPIVAPPPRAVPKHGAHKVGGI